MNEKVSVIIPLYNAEKYIEKTLESIVRQTYKNIEIIVVDDASTDSSLKIVEKKDDERIKIFRNSCNKGIAYTRNRAISMASGTYIALMDDDDLAPVDRIEKEMKYVALHSDVDVVLGHMIEIDDEDVPCSHVFYSFLNPRYLRARQLLSNCIPNGSTVIKKEFIDRFKLTYKDEMHGAEDYRFWVECLVNGAKFGTVDEVLLYHRIHANNACSIAKKNHCEERKRVIEDIQRMALSQSGFSFSEEQYLTFFKNFKEEINVLCNIDEIQSLYNSLYSLGKQAEELQLDNKEEIKIMCRKYFGEKIQNAFFLWE